MRRRVMGLCVVCLAAGLVLSAQAPDKSAEVLAGVRTALGGAKLDAVKSVVATGRTRRVRGDNLVPIEFELAIELPDKFYRKDEVPAEESAPTTSGFNGDGLVQLPPPAVMPARPGGPPPPTPEQLAGQRKARVLTLKQDFTRWALGFFAAPVAGYPLTFKYYGDAEAPQGKADVIDVTGAPNFAVRLFADKATHIPVMVSWTVAPPPARGAMPGAAPPAGAAAAPAVAPVEHRIYFADYRDTDGVKFPFRLRRAVGADTTEETTFDRFRINTRIDPKKFEVIK